MSGGSPAAAASAGRAAEASPRLDWRFLLAEPELDRVGYVGKPNVGLLAPLRSLCRSVEMLDTRGGRAAEAYEVVVAHEPSESELRLAAERVRPGGALVVEVRGPLGAMKEGDRAWSALHSPQRVARRVSALGFEDVRSYWHWPSFDRCTRIIPLHDRGAVRYALARAGQRAQAQAGARLARALLEMGLLGWAVASSSVIGRRASEPRRSGKPVAERGAPDRLDDDGATARGPSVVHDFLRDRWEELSLDRYAASPKLPFVILTPRFRNSSHLVFLLLDEGASEPVLVAKLPRLPGRCVKVEHEGERLREIQACRPDGFASIPRVVALETHGDRTVLIQTALRGRAMDRATVRREAARCCETVLTWLVEVQTATRLAPDQSGRAFERLIARELAIAQATLPAEGLLLEKTRAAVTPLATASFPLVLEHRDLAHPNLLIDPRGGLSVIDWELAELHGLPMADLFFFLAYVAIAQRNARSSEEALSAVDGAFFGRQSWARAYVHRYAGELSLSRELLTPLFVACWMRQLVGLARRVAGDAGDSSAPDAELADWLRRDWRFAVWRHAVEQTSRLQWEDLP